MQQDNEVNVFFLFLVIFIIYWLSKNVLSVIMLYVFSEIEDGLNIECCNRLNYKCNKYSAWPLC